VRGVKAIEYGVVGDVLFWSLKICVGTTIFTDAVLAVWVKIFSRMLRTIVPTAVKFERQGLFQPEFKRVKYQTSVMQKIEEPLSTARIEELNTLPNP
jgi:hypothetical protein